MPLTRIRTGAYESPNFQMVRPTTKKGWYIVEARTDQGALVLHQRTTAMPSKDAKRLIRTMERQLLCGGPILLTHILQGTLAPPSTPAAVDTRAADAQALLKSEGMAGDDLIALRELLFPGASITAGRSALATYLSMTVDHIRHMETGVKQIFPRTVRLLKMYASRVLTKQRAVTKHETVALQPFAELYTALAETTPPQKGHTDESGRETPVD